MRLQLLLFLLAQGLALVCAHIAMTVPCARYNPWGEDCPELPAGETLDYNLKSPISTAGQSDMLPFCHHEKPWPTPAAKWKAGQSITVKFTPDGAGHGGGHCQFSVSYDSGKTYVVVHEVLEHCFFNGPSDSNTMEVTSYTFDLPDDLPSSDKAIFAWSWVNSIGNREFYMDCADVTISGSSSSYTGKKMTVANRMGYATIDAFGGMNGDYTTGLEQYNSNVTYVTVTGDGGVTEANKPSGSDGQSNQQDNNGEDISSGDDDEGKDSNVDNEKGENTDDNTDGNADDNTDDN
ncbi:hypothetical protein BX667DRAFT_478781, partial [Coemansia mojavensis]